MNSKSLDLGVKEFDLNSIIKKDNEKVFLQNMEKINYNSLIIFEIFNLEDFNVLIKGIDKLFKDYKNVDPFFEYKLNKIKKNINKSNNLEFPTNFPRIYNYRFKEFEFVELDLGANIKSIKIILNHIFPSIVVMQIHAKLTQKVSDKINDIIYRVYKEEDLLFLDEYSEYTDPFDLKCKEITNIRVEIKHELVDFLKRFFNGFFFRLNDDISLIPSIDLLSLNYPTKNKEIIQWGNDNRYFLDCFNSIISPYDSYRKGNYLLNSAGKNWVILANHMNKEPEGKVIKFSESSLQDSDFNFIAINQWLDAQINDLEMLQLSISQKIQKLEFIELNEPLECLEELSKKSYYFTRFKTEFNKINRSSYISDFTLLEDKVTFELYKIHPKLFDGLFESLTSNIENYEKLIDTLNKHLNLILKLKDVKYNKETQDSIKKLTWIVILLAIIQIILVIIPLVYNRST